MTGLTRAEAARRLAACFGVSALVACGAPPQRTAARADTPRTTVLGVVSGPASVQSTVTTTPTPSDTGLVAAVAAARAAMPPDTGPPTPLSPEARGACDAVAALWEVVPGARIGRGDTLVRPGDVLGDSVLAEWTDRPTGPSVTACFVRGEAAAGVDSLARDRLSWGGGRNGWIAFPRMSGDGPDGGVMHYQRGLTRCRVDQQWDAGDDSDTAYVPSPYYGERIVCWRHWRALVPADTIYLPGG